MPARRTAVIKLDREVSHVQSVVQAMRRGREWIDDALCAQPPYDDYKWIIEPSTGYEEPGSVAKLLEVCSRCPVRRERLLDVLNETSYTPTGIFGGSTRTERERVFRQGRENRTPETIQRAFELLEATLPARLALWRERAVVALAVRRNGGPKPPGHPTATLLSKPPKSEEADWVRGPSLREIEFQRYERAKLKKKTQRAKRPS